MLENARNDEQKAIAELNKALALNPANRQARQLLEQAATRSRATP
jgi:hypothetical protein